MTDTTTALRLANELRDPQATMTSRLCAADAIAALAQERDALVERSRWNIREEGDDLLICRGDHHRAEKCEWERYVPATERDAARAEVERIKSAWLFVIQAENSCAASGAPCRGGGKCGCAAELEMLLREHDERAALAAKGEA